LEREGASFHERVRDGYLTLARADGARWTILDGTNPPAEVSDAAFRALAAKLPV
jgi:dTMP kinase